MANADDWRLSGQERYLIGVALRLKPYARWSETWDHDHCDFCWAEFCVDEDCDSLKEGYAVAAHTTDRRTFPDDYHWICPGCYEDSARCSGGLCCPRSRHYRG